MKIFVTGGTGLLGAKLIELGKKEFEVFSSVRNLIKSEGCNFVQFDITERNKVFDVLERIADITTAGLARSDNIYDDTISSDILQQAYKNTIELLKRNIEVESS